MTITNEMERFYHENMAELEKEYEEMISYRDFGSGEDRISVNEDMFWEFVEEKMEEQKQKNKSSLVSAMQKLPSWYRSFGWKIDLLIIASLMVYLLKG